MKKKKKKEFFFYTRITKNPATDRDVSRRLKQKRVKCFYTSLLN